MSIARGHSKNQHHGANARAAHLSAEHAAMLFDESGISPEIAAERGYRTIYRRSDVPPDFRPYQRRAPALLIPTQSPDGITAGHQLRPDTLYRKKNGEPYRYASPSGAPVIADVHPRNREAAANPEIPLWITEGVKKADAMTSRGLCAMALMGVWMFRPKDSDQMIPCFDHIPLRGRDVRIVYDSDVMTKPEVQMALARLVDDLEGRGAQVLVVYLPDAPDGSKQGVDDYLAAGGSAAHLEEMARPFEPTGYLKSRLSRDERLRAGLFDLRNTWERRAWGRHYSRRKAMRALIEEAAQHGKPVADGIRVVMAERPAAEKSGTSRNTVAKALQGLEHDDGLIRRDGFGKDGKTAAYVLLTDTISEEGAKGGHSDRNTCKSNGSSYRVSFSSGPLSVHIGQPVPPSAGSDDLKRLRYSYTQRQWTEEGWEYVYIERLGPIRGHAVECLLAAGGSLTVRELLAAMGRDEKPNKFVSRHVSKLVAYELVNFAGDRVSLTSDWPIKLEMARYIGGEYAAEERTRERHARQREAYKRRRETKADDAPNQRQMDERRWERKARKPDGRVHELARESEHFRDVFVGSDDGQRPLGSEYAERKPRRMILSEPKAEPPEPERKLPPKVGGVYQHGPECECWVCGYNHLEGNH